ncbi:hypothetical protein BaRGS_00033788 [Batillaria attramentaria]|uniref:JmjC domain-containing protein n=1 Tax=Batillaria attramentaria TaxID=370345 RepID=A0ABD0JKH7_9CAEN
MQSYVMMGSLMSVLAIRMTLSSVQNILLVAGLAVVLKDVRFSGANATSVEDYLRVENADTDLKLAYTNGGWELPDTETFRKLHTSRCNIKRISVKDLDLERFEAEFRLKKPVIVTFPNGAADWTVPEKWSQDYLRKTFGLQQASSGTADNILGNYGQASEQHSFTDFTDRLMRQTSPGSSDARWYVWDRGFYKNANISSSLRLPPYFAARVGATGSGLTFHTHYDAWNGMVFGKKRWFVYPDNKSPPGGMKFTNREWYEIIYPKLTREHRPLECVQEEGEIIYVPEGYYHAVMNIGDSIGFAVVARGPTTVVQKLTHLQDTGQHEETVKKLLEAINFDPHNIIPYIILSRKLEKLNRLNEAEEVLLQVRELLPAHGLVHAEYGAFLLRTGRYAEAVPVLKTVSNLTFGIAKDPTTLSPILGLQDRW